MVSCYTETQLFIFSYNIAICLYFVSPATHTKTHTQYTHTAQQEQKVAERAGCTYNLGRKI